MRFTNSPAEDYDETAPEDDGPPWDEDGEE